MKGKLKTVVRAVLTPVLILSAATLPLLPASANGGPAIHEVTQRIQLTANEYYERDESVVYDGETSANICEGQVQVFGSIADPVNQYRGAVSGWHSAESIRWATEGPYRSDMLRGSLHHDEVIVNSALWTVEKAEKKQVIKEEETSPPTKESQLTEREKDYIRVITGIIIAVLIIVTGALLWVLWRRKRYS